MRAASAAGHHHIAAAAAAGQLADAGAQLGVLLADKAMGPIAAKPKTLKPPPPPQPPAQEPSQAAVLPRILARRVRPHPTKSKPGRGQVPTSDAGADSGPEAEPDGDPVNHKDAENPSRHGGVPGSPERLTDDVREALLVSARALAALGEPDEVEGLRAFAARVFAPLPGLLTGCKTPAPTPCQWFTRGGTARSACLHCQPRVCKHAACSCTCLTLSVLALFPEAALKSALMCTTRSAQGRRAAGVGRLAGVDARLPRGRGRRARARRYAAQRPGQARGHRRRAARRRGGGPAGSVRRRRICGGGGLGRAGGLASRTAGVPPVYDCD